VSTPFRILFWNTRRRLQTAFLTALAQDHRPHVFVLAECPDAEQQVTELKATIGEPLRYNPSGKTAVLSRLPASCLRHCYSGRGQRFAIHRVLLGGGPGMLLAHAHLPSRVAWDSVDQAHASTSELAEEIRHAERWYRTTRTILVGDLNQNPFDPAVVGHRGLHAISTRERAKAGGRSVQGEYRPYFYNPMWSYFGDDSPGPPGTYHFQSGTPVSLFWNMYDQVMVRPALIPNLHSVAILDRAGPEPLVTRRGYPRSRDVSDHLPLLVTLEV
jgi:endonuclease/exonuclease/phosphatase family metal-dependent hydrolase